MSAAVIRLHPDDNIVVCRRTVHRGERIVVDGIEAVTASDADLGHKLALIAIPLGGKVLKYGMAIGSATVPIAPGDWVHMHNMKSDYMPAHLRDATGSQP